MKPESLVGIWTSTARPTNTACRPICFVANSRRWVIGKLASTSSGAALDTLRSSNRRYSRRRLRRSRLADRQSENPFRRAELRYNLRMPQTMLGRTTPSPPTHRPRQRPIIPRVLRPLQRVASSTISGVKKNGPGDAGTQHRGRWQRRADLMEPPLGRATVEILDGCTDLLGSVGPQTIIGGWIPPVGSGSAYI